MSASFTQPEEVKLVIREMSELGHMQGGRSIAGRAQESAITEGDCDQVGCCWREGCMAAVRKGVPS